MPGRRLCGYRSTRSVATPSKASLNMRTMSADSLLTICRVSLSQSTGTVTRPSKAGSVTA